MLDRQSGRSLSKRNERGVTEVAEGSVEAEGAHHLRDPLPGLCISAFRWHDLVDALRACLKLNFRNSLAPP
jgi:hypothetical protein